ncbi:coproporphyrinogen III oxidase, partial [Micromonospora azadirachtae]
MPGVLPDGEPVPADGSLPVSATREVGARGFGVYVHVPFCASRCGYCDFNTYTAAELGAGATREGYADTVLAELRLAARVLGD